MATVGDILQESERLGKLADTLTNVSNKLSDSNNSLTDEEKKNILKSFKSVGLYMKELEDIRNILRCREYQLKDSVYKVEVDIK